MKWILERLKNRLRPKVEKEILCLSCYYRSVTRSGLVCSFDGTFHPSKTECAHYRRR